MGAYQTGGVNEQAAIHVYDSETAQDSVAVLGNDLRLVGLWADWLVYQKLNADDGYDIWVEEIAGGNTENISLDMPASISNRPYLEGGRVYWRHVQGGQTSGQVCYLARDPQPGLVPTCLFASTGFKIFSGFRIYIAEGDSAEMRFRDGSTLTARSGTYLVFQALAPSDPGIVQATLNATFVPIDIKEFEDAVEAYRQAGDSNGLDLGELPVRLSEIHNASLKLARDAESGIANSTGAGHEAPRYLHLISGGLSAVAGAADRLGAIYRRATHGEHQHPQFELLSRPNSILPLERISSLSPAPRDLRTARCSLSRSTRNLPASTLELRYCCA